MKTTFLFLFLSCICARAIDKITATLTFTNATATGNTLTVNGNVRTWTNQVFVSGTQIITNSDATGCGSKTNALSQIALNPFSQVTPLNTGSNTFQLSAPCGVALVVSAVGTYVAVTYSTQVCGASTPIGVPFSSYYPPVLNRTNAAAQLEQDLLDYSPNSKLVDLAKTQTITGPKTFTNQNNSYNGRLSNSVPTANSLNGGYWLNLILNVPILTNGVNYGNAFSSPGLEPQTEQFGAGAVATNSFDMAIGINAIAAGGESIAIGPTSQALQFASTALGSSALAWKPDCTAVGDSAIANGQSASAFGANAEADGSNSTAIGTAAFANFANSTAIGVGATTTATNQIMLGAPGISTIVQNNLTVQANATIGGSFFVTGGENVLGLRTNAAFTGTNNFPPGADIAFGRFANSSLANGNNSAVLVGTNVFCDLSGPSAGFTICGIAGGRDGKVVILKNSTTFTMTIANQSGNDPTAANRILTGLTGDYSNTNNPGCVTLIYDANVSRWIVAGHN